MLKFDAIIRSLQIYKILSTVGNVGLQLYSTGLVKRMKIIEM